MKKLFTKSVHFFCVGILLLCVSCSKDDGAKTPSLSDFEFSGIFTGTLYNNGTTSPLEGYITIAANGSTDLNLLSGNMRGISVKQGNSYAINITQTEGAFANITNITGSIDTTTRSIYLSGTNPDGSSMTVGGDVPELQTTGGWENLLNSSVIFTHDESCKATVTVDGVSFSGLNKFYHPGGRCDSYYALWNTIPFNYDNIQSQIFCNSGTLVGLDGNPVAFTDCSTVQYILPKNTQHTYTVNWENGQVSTGSFTTPDGGGTLAICPSNEGPECDGTGGGLVGSAGNPRFNLQFTAGYDLDLYVKTPDGTLIYYGNRTGQGGELDVDCQCGSSTSNGTGENVFWQTGPAGTYQYYVKFYSSCSSSNPNANYTVRVMNNSTIVQSHTGTLTTGGTTPTWTYIKN